MKLTDLLGKDVVDPSGKRLGRVEDLHLVQDGKPMLGGDNAFRLHGLIVGRRSFGTRLGYVERPGFSGSRRTRGPWLIAVIIRALHRGAVYVPWNDVDEVSERCVRVVAR
jgi:hypothetical protein